MSEPNKCDCCGREFTLANSRDWIYGCCNECAVCCSLEHFPCCHGSCAKKSKEEFERRMGWPLEPEEEFP